MSNQLKNLSRPVLKHGGSVKHITAEQFAKTQYAKFDRVRREFRKLEADKELAELKRLGASLPKAKKPGTD